MTTQNCAECGTPAEPGQSFCDACGAVLSWDQAGAARTARPAAATSDQRPGFDAFAGAGVPPARTGRPATAPADEPAGAIGENPTLPQQRRTAGDADSPAGDAAATTGDTPGTGNTPGAAPGAGAAADPDAAPGAAARPAPGTDETAPTAPVPSAAASAPAPNALTDTMSDRARSLLVPVADPEAPAPAAPPAVPPVLPGRPDADRPQVRAPGHQPDIANGPPCPWCSTPNRPDRHYCARCAMPLVASGDQASLRAPWWRRLFGGRRQETPWAGDRPRLRRVFDRIGTWITVAVVATLAVLGFMYIPDGVQNTRDHFAKRAPVSPDGIKASRSFPGHNPELLIDKLSNTWWGPGITESGQGQWVEASFTEPTRLLDVIITPGVSTRADKLRESALPHRVKATITMKDGSVKTRDLTLDQGAGGQRRPFRVGEVTKVRFTIESAHAASAKKQVAISEIEFFGPSSANRSS
ncbi:zinc ribbon domain-containing protein [Streptomyces sp. WM6391]|uniref:zinc ribbon domain-containing protein n=1 Tax=Streptomyces sp. WM6391 TaxID=1415559 RepID=UPI0006194D9C|nr:zinc ribbon domain-containing protein [Streptomyces sp. WM6391]KKD10358.1 membrane protein [Streptomyces sp. WM6391]